MENQLIDNNNVKAVTISETTNNMVNLLREYTQFQNKLIVMFEEKEDSEDLIETSTEMYHLLQNAISCNICETLDETQMAQL